MRTLRILLGTALMVAPIATVHGADREAPVPVSPTLTWLSNLDEALASAKKSGKPILLEFR